VSTVAGTTRLRDLGYVESVDFGLVYRRRAGKCSDQREASEIDCVAGHVGFELANPSARYPIGIA
jgi:hypothetical protein